MAVYIARIQKILNVVATPAEGGVLDANTTYYGKIFAYEKMNYSVNEIVATSPVSDEFTFTTDSTKKSASLTWDVPVSANCGALGYSIILTKVSGVYYNKEMWGNPVNYTQIISTNSYVVGSVAKFGNTNSSYNIPWLDPANKLPFGMTSIIDQGTIRVFARGAFTLQDIKNQADADGLSTHIYYDGLKTFAIFGGIKWFANDCAGVATSMTVLNHDIVFVCSSGVGSWEYNVTLNFGASNGTGGCSISNYSVYTVYDFYSLLRGVFNFYGCRINTYKYACFKSGASGINFYKCSLYFSAGCYVTGAPIIDNTIIGNPASGDNAYAPAYRKDIDFINMFIYSYKSFQTGVEKINCRMFNDAVYDIAAVQSDLYDAFYINCQFLTLAKVLRTENRARVYWQGIKGENTGIIFLALIKINSNPNTLVTIKDKDGNNAILYAKQSTGQQGAIIQNITTDSNGFAECYVKYRTMMKGQYVGSTTGTYISTETDYYPFEITLSKNGYETHTENNVAIYLEYILNVTLKTAKPIRYFSGGDIAVASSPENGSDAILERV